MHRIPRMSWLVCSRKRSAACWRKYQDFCAWRAASGLRALASSRLLSPPEIPRWPDITEKLLQDYFGIETKLEIGEGKTVGKTQAGQKYAYSLTIDADNRSEQILRETGILLVREGNNYISDGIYSGIIGSKCCKKAYLRGVFMGVGTMSDPEKAYDLEFVLESQNMANDLKKLINAFVDLSCKVAQRGKRLCGLYEKSRLYQRYAGHHGCEPTGAFVGRNPHQEGHGPCR